MTFYSAPVPESELSDFPEPYSRPTPLTYWTPRFVVFKKICDIGFALLALPVIFTTALLLLALNPFYNPGPLFFRQERMGLGGRKIMLWKFRTMTGSTSTLRHVDAPLEQERITRLGRILRRTRIDELPNFINVLAGEMSLVGPRPDAWDHAMVHLDDTRYYCDRFRVLPGITGLAQVRGGYADDRRATERKARLDRFYVRRSRIKLDLLIIFQTVRVLITGFGAR